MKASENMIINWERDENGDGAFLVQPKPDGFIAMSAAKAIAKSLMHDVTVISACFDQHDLIVFSRYAGIALFGEEFAVFYGLYGASGVSAGPDYCMRRCLWERSFRSKDAVLKGLSSKTLFFISDDLSEDLGRIIETIDKQSFEACNITMQPSSAPRFNDKQISYTLGDDSCDLSCMYWGRSAKNLYIENLFEQLEMIFCSLNEEICARPISNTFRISFSFQNLLGIVGSGF